MNLHMKGANPKVTKFGTVEKIIKSFLVKNVVEPKKVGHADSYLLDVKSLVNFAVSIFVSEANQYPC